MDILDLHVNCQVSLRSKQSKLGLYGNHSIDAWPTSSHVPSLMEVDHHRNRHRNAGYSDHCSGFYPIEGHYDHPNVPTSNDHWSAYTLHHPYYHGYGQQDAADLFPPSPIVVPAQQYCPSWHLPYSSDSGHGNLDHYGQMYYQARDTVLYPSVDRSLGATDRQYNLDSSSDHYSSFAASQNDHGNRGQFRNDFNVNSKYTDRKPCVQSNDRDANMCKTRRLTINKDLGNILHQSMGTETNSNTETVAFYSKEANKHTQEDLYDSQPSYARSADSDRPSVFQISGHCEQPSVFQLSSHVRKQERKMKKTLQELQKSDITKATQLLEFYQFNMAVLEQQYERCAKDAYNVTGQGPTPGDYDFQVQRIIQQVHQKIAISGYRQTDNRKSAGVADVRKTRLLPKHAVKTLDSWFEDNLNNPYPSRDQTLRLALDCGLSIEQVRKWFANKRNRSRNNKHYK